MIDAGNKPVFPSDEEASLARETGKVLASGLQNEQPVQLLGPDRTPAELPPAAARLLARMLSEMANGNAVALIPIRSGSSMEEAAGILDISQSDLLALLEQGRIQWSGSGRDRRVLFGDLKRYKRERDADRGRALEALVAYDQELGI
ncbi:MAG: helix-turn-helix domain-containing protein [Bryobacteraceae bacterium]